MNKLKLMLLLNLNIFVNSPNNNIDEIIQQIELLLEDFEDSEDFNSNVLKNIEEFYKILHENDFEDLNEVFPDLFNSIFERIKTNHFFNFQLYLNMIRELNEESENIDFKELDKKIPGLLKIIIATTEKNYNSTYMDTYKDFLQNLKILNKESKNINFKDLGLSEIFFTKIERSSPEEFIIFLRNIKKLSSIKFNEQNIPILKSIIEYIQFEENNIKSYDILLKNIETFNEKTKMINFDNFNKNFPNLLDIFFGEINFNYFSNFNNEYNKKLKLSDPLFEKFGNNIILLNERSGSEEIDFKKIYDILDFHEENKEKDIELKNNERINNPIYKFSKQICYKAQNETKSFEEFLRNIEIFNHEAKNFDFKTVPIVSLEEILIYDISCKNNEFKENLELKKNIIKTKLLPLKKEE
jgi:hypothetical protein